ncbi:MAG: hypothetical protein KA764_03935, partial [Anaerolineales bacterium]|nr:hypothetical protein [Anaerolineales bacterium]
MTAATPSHPFQRILSILLATVLLATPALVPGTPRTVEANKTYILQGAAAEQVAEAVERAGGQVTARLTLIRGVVAVLSTAALQRLSADLAISSIQADAVVTSDGTKVPGDEAQADDGDEKAKSPRDNATQNNRPDQLPATDYPDVIGADYVWAQGVTGTGITVAVVDSGIDQHIGLVKDIDGKPK